MLSISGELIVSRRAHNKPITDGGKFWPCRPLPTAYKKFCTQLTKAYVAKTSYLQLLFILLLSAHNQFTRCMDETAQWHYVHSCACTSKLDSER